MRHDTAKGLFSYGLVARCFQLKLFGLFLLGLRTNNNTSFIQDAPHFNDLVPAIQNIEQIMQEDEFSSPLFSVVFLHTLFM
jgi:hypothetical protein